MPSAAELLTPSCYTYHKANLAREAALLEKLRHPCICALYGAVTVMVRWQPLTPGP